MKISEVRHRVAREKFIIVVCEKLKYYYLQFRVPIYYKPSRSRKYLIRKNFPLKNSPEKSINEVLLYKDNWFRNNYGLVLMYNIKQHYVYNRRKPTPPVCPAEWAFSSLSCTSKPRFSQIASPILPVGQTNG